MTIDLDRLKTRHPELPDAIASSLCLLAALALQRRHKPGVALSADVRGASTSHTITWQVVDGKTGDQVDRHRATEDGAEAVALGLAHEACQWVVLRRLQRRQYGDWLLQENGSGRKLVFEIGGLDEGSLTAKLRGELDQVVKSPLPFARAACVVRFFDVRARLVEVAHGAPVPR
jgi:hypothetical protein